MGLLPRRPSYTSFEHSSNGERLHGALNYRSPDRFYQEWAQDQTNGEFLWIRP